MKASLLIVDDEKHTREGLGRFLSADYEVSLARDGEEAIQLLSSHSFDIVLTDLRMAGKSGLAVIDHALSLEEPPVCVMMTAYGSVESAVEAMKRGAADFLIKPLNLEELELVLKRLWKNKALQIENQNLHQRLDQHYQFSGLIGNAPSFKKAIDQLIQVASTKATVLLQGETGTGKELAAQLIHQNSPRARQPFVPLHCAALPSHLLESELFGYEKGAFTGATERRKGRFEVADGGTLFLDEIGEIDLSTQVKLLRFLETKAFERLGSTQAQKVDVRIVAATHKNLMTQVEKGLFREDLYYRLNVVPIAMPPLRERTEDIPLLIGHYIQIFAKENKLTPPNITPEALKALQAYGWPGNIRELRNICENWVVLRAGRNISMRDLPSHMKASTKTALTSPLSKLDNEKNLIRKALQQTKGNRSAAADLLGISRRTLHRKLKEWPELEGLAPHEEAIGH